MKTLAHLKLMKIRDEMTTGVTTIGMAAPLADAIDAMAINNISAVVVVYPNGAGAGVISSFDIVKVLREKTPEEIRKMTCDDVMSEAMPVEPDKTMEDALNLMLDEGIHRVVIFSPAHSGNKPIGVISATDIVKKISQIQHGA
jgi:predicted transcriptional regulator